MARRPRRIVFFSNGAPPLGGEPIEPLPDLDSTPIDPAGQTRRIRNEGQPLEQGSIVGWQVAVEKAISEVETSRVVFDPHEIAQGREQLGAVCLDPLEIPAAFDGLPDDRNEEGMEPSDPGQPPGDAIGMPVAIDPGRAVEPASTVDEHHGLTMTVHFEQATLHRCVGRDDGEIDREIVRETPSQVDRLIEAGPVWFDETVSMADSDQAIESFLEGLKGDRPVARRHRHHQIEIAS